jgi:acetyl coenzyme A synthetase (ADP forming)-like protein
MITMTDRLFNPKSIAVIGASNDKKKVGFAVLDNLLKFNYKGKIYPINQKHKKVSGLKAYKSVLDVPGIIDLAVVAIPSIAVPSVLEEAGIKKISHAIIISSGFGETGEEGKKLEQLVLEIARKYNMRLLGPNCLGIINCRNNVNASFATKTPPKGDVAFLSQSGALCTAILDWSQKVNFGFSKFISLGNNLDLHEADILEYLGTDSDTKVILMYIEGIKDGKRFIDVASKVSKKKPIIVIKSGQTDEGAKAVLSHTGSIAGKDALYDAAFNKAGVIRAEDVETLFELARVFSSLHPPSKNGAAIVTNAGGPGVLAIDACSKYKLKVAELSKSTIDSLAKKLPRQANTKNPVDVIGDASAQTYKDALDAVLKDANVGSCLVILTPQKMTEIKETAEVVVSMYKKYKKPIVCSFMGGVDTAKGTHILKKANIPHFDTPDDAIRALAGLTKYYCEILKKETPDYPVIKGDRQRVEKMLAVMKSDKRTIPNVEQGFEMLSAYGIETPKSEVAANESEAVEKSRAMGYPVVMKINSPDISHKSDIGAIVKDIDSDDEARVEFRKIIDNSRKAVPGARINGVQIQKQLKGREFVVGINKDATFGQFATFGFGGVYVEILRDISNRLLPLSKQDVWSMMREIKSFKILEGVRGETPADIDSVADLIMKIAQLASDFNLDMIEVNPVIVLDKGKGCFAVDVRAKL